jgi:hypothetical protein
MSTEKRGRRTEKISTWTQWCALLSLGALLLCRAAAAALQALEVLDTVLVPTSKGLVHIENALATPQSHFVQALVL